MLSTKTWRNLAVLCCVHLVCSGCAPPEERIFDSITSPDGRYTVSVAITEPWMPHGRFKITVYVADQTTGRTEQMASRTLENDGVPFTEQNIALRWISEHMALLCLRSTDLHDEGVRIIVSDKPVAEIIDEC